MRYASFSAGDKRSAIGDENCEPGNTPSSSNYNILRNILDLPEKSIVIFKS